MKFLLQIQFRGMAPSDFVTNNVWDHAEKLGKFYDRLISCHVIVSTPHRHKHRGKIYHVQLRLHAPGGDINVTTEPEHNPTHEDVYVAVHDAFDAARRRLEDFVRRQRGLVKERHVLAHAKVVRLFPNEDCGFIATPDRRELYFHRNSVLNNDFFRLRVGAEVRFSEEIGEKGPQVTSMSLVGHSHLVV